MFFSDRLTLDKPRRTSDGFMAIHARSARTGIYQYLGREVDPEGKHFAADQIVNVYRSPDEVFSKDALGSFVGKPITDDHPSEAVTAANWRDLARGTIHDANREIADDGEYVGFDLAFMDAGLIAKIDDGKRELSNGYSCDVVIGDGVAPDGTAFQAKQTNIRGNHVAVVTDGRAGSSCRIGDASKCDPIPSDEVKKLLVDQRTYDAAIDSAKTGGDKTGDSKVKLITVDGHSIDISNEQVAEHTINKIIGQRDEAIEGRTAAETQVATLTTDKATLEAEKTTLEQKVKDAQITPEMLRDAAKEFADVQAKAKALGIEFGDSDSTAQIMKKTVDAKLGDSAKDWNESQIEASFAALTSDVKPDDATPGDKLTDGLAFSGPRPMADSRAGIASARQKALARKGSAYLN